MDKLIYLVVLFTVVLLQLGMCNSLRCYGCSSTKSWQDCEKTKTAMDCPDIPYKQPACFRVEKKYPTRGHLDYAANCIYTKRCNSYFMCQNTTSCKYTCCQKDLCNVSLGRRVHISIITTVVAVALSLMYITF